MKNDFGWHWLRDHRRKRILESPFPSEWNLILDRNVAHFRRVREESRKSLRDLIQVFVAEKNWEGCGGLVLTDEIQVTIAAGACLMVLALPHDLYRDVSSIFVYPSTVMTPERRPGVFENSPRVVSAPFAILGEAMLGGPIILVWDSVLRSARHPEAGHNVVYHEFAHKLDMLTGRADGTPPIADCETLRRWVDVCSREFLRLRELCARGKPTFLDAYGATSEAEFFAVVTEQFFDQPRELARLHRDLYDLFREFYRQDPASQDSG